MGWIREALVGVVPDTAFLEGLSIKESGKRFSIQVRPTDAEDGAGIRFGAGWPQVHGGRTCDAVFVLHAPARRTLLVVFVELKGSHVGEALQQIAASYDRLHGDRRVHEQTVIERFKNRLGPGAGHARRALGVVVARSGMSQHQKDRAGLARDGLHVRIRKQRVVVGVAELYDWWDQTRGERDDGRGDRSPGKGGHGR